MRCGSPTNRTVRNPHGSVRPTNRTATPRVGSWLGANRHGSLRFATVRQTTAVCTPRFFSVRDIFSRAFDTHAQQVSFSSSSAYAQIVFADSRVAAAFHLAQLSRARRLQKDCIFTPSLYSPTPTLPHVLVFDHIFLVFAHSQYSTVAVLQLSLTLGIRRSRFGNFCSIAAFDSRILATFLLSHAAPAPRSRVRSHFCTIRSLSVFDGRVLATFP